MAMFIGFIDDDGYFDTGEQKQYNPKTKARGPEAEGPTVPRPPPPALVKSTIIIRLASNVNNIDFPY